MIFIIRICNFIIIHHIVASCPRTFGITSIGHIHEFDKVLPQRPLEPRHLCMLDILQSNILLFQQLLYIDSPNRLTRLLEDVNIWNDVISSDESIVFFGIIDIR